MLNYVKDGDVLTLTAPYDRTGGQGALIGNIFAVAIATISSGATGAFVKSGVFDLTKATGVAISAGARVFWDDVNKWVTTVATNNWPIGACEVAAQSGDATVRVVLDEANGYTAGAVATRVLAAMPVTAVANTDFTLTVPTGYVLRITQRTTTAYTGATATVQVGTTAGGAELVAATDITGIATRTLTLVAANTATYSPLSVTTLNVRIAQTTPTAVGAGHLIVEIAPNV